MIPTIQDWVHQNYSSFRADEVNPKLWKVILCAPALLALGAQTFGSLPLQPIIVTIAVADAFFHYVAVRNPEFCKKAKQYEWVFYSVRLAALTWSIGHLFQLLTPVFPLTGASILRTYSTPLPDWLNYPSSPYGKHFFDRWILSWPVTIGGIMGMNRLVDKMHQWIATEKVLHLRDVKPKNIKNFIINVDRNPEQHLPTAPLWLAVLQQVVNISLAIFSKSPLVFSGLSGLNLYTFSESILYTTCLQQVIITLQFWKYYEKFEYKEQFAIRKNAKKEVAREVERLCNEAEAFKLFNFQRSDNGKSYTIHCLTMPFWVSNSNQSGQISNNQLLYKDSKIECKLVQLSYQQGMKIPIQIDKCDKDFNILRITLGNGTIVKFFNVLTSQVLKMGTKTIDATIESIQLEYKQLYLLCSSTDLPKAEKLAFTWNKTIRKLLFTLNATVFICEKGQKQAPCSKCESISNLFYYESCEPYSAVCKSCIKEDFENRVKNFTIVNKITRLYHWSDDCKVWAEKEQLPEGSKLEMKPSDGFSTYDVDIGWLDYSVGKIVNVQLNSVCEGVASGILPDNTNVKLFGYPEGAKEMMQAQKKIDAQIVSKYVEDNVLVLECISRPLTPKWISSTISIQFGSLELLCRVDCKPALSDLDKMCNICSNTSEILFYNCVNNTHTACLPCLRKHLKVQCDKLKICNFALNSTSRIPSICIDQESLPNCLYCRSPVVEGSQLAVLMQNVKAQILILDYKIDDIVQFHIGGFFEDGTPYGELDNRTLVEVTGLERLQAETYKYFQTPINAKILKKTIQNGRLCLSCTFISAETL